MPEVSWEQSSAGVSDRRVAELSSSGVFLEAITFGWLVQMVAFRHRADPKSVLVPPTHAALPSSALTPLLTSAKNARNDVAHNRFLGQNYQLYEATLLRLLEILHFDVARARGRLEAERTVFLQKR